MYSKMQSRAGYFGHEAVALEPLAGDHHDLAVLHLAHELGADDVERAGLGGEHPGVAELAEDERPDAERIARADQLLMREADQGIGAFDLEQGFDQLLDEAPLLAAGDEMQDHLGIGGRLADGAFFDEGIRASVRALVRLPLWPRAKPPESRSTNSGCTLRSTGSPQVE